MFDRARGTITFARALPAQRRIPYLPAERAEALRDERVRDIVGYAVETVPYYRDLFRREGIDPREIRTAGDLARVPLLEKEAVQEDPERFRSRSPAVADAVLFRTSGSTALPLLVYHDRRALLLNIAHSERDRVVEATLCGKRVRYTAVDLHHSRGTLSQVQSFYRGTTFRPFRPARHYVGMEQPLDDIVAELNRLQPDVLRGNGSHLEVFFRTVVARSVDLHLPRVVVYFGEAMNAAGRALLEEQLGVAVVSRYGAVEAFKIGYHCEERRGFHLYEDLCDVRILKSDGSPTAENEVGEVVVSNLLNRATVLLNYRLGDLARLVPRGCPCGRTSPLLAGLEGRVREIIHLPNGDFVYPAPVTSLASEMEGVIRFQFVQLEADRFELRLVAVDDSAYDRAVERMLPELHELLPGCVIEPTRRAELPPEPGGKFRPIVPLGSPRPAGDDGP